MKIFLKATAIATLIAAVILAAGFARVMSL